MGNIGSTNVGESKQLLAEEVFHHIGRQIIDGTLAAGERIRDVDVAEELHVSRTPVREGTPAVGTAGNGHDVPEPVHGRSRRVTAETIAQSLVFAGYQAGIAARLAVPQITAAQREHVLALVNAMRAALEDGAGTSNARWAVFSYLGEHSGNAQHRTLIDDASMVLFRNLRDWVVPPSDRARMAQIYVDFGDAVRSGDGDSAERLVREMYYL